jgi:head-tail adaptor
MDFSTDELTGFKTAQTNHMMDTVVRQTYSATSNSYNEDVVTYTDQTAIKCGLDMRPGSERHTSNYTALEYDATMRLPITTTIDARDRLKITKRFGETLTTALVFEIVGPVQRGPSGIRLLLKRVEA